MTQLQSLNVSRCDIPRFDGALEKLINLRSLNISYCNQLPKEELIIAIAKLTELRKLEAYGQKFSDFRKVFPHLNVYCDAIRPFIT